MNDGELGGSGGHIEDWEYMKMLNKCIPIRPVYRSFHVLLGGRNIERQERALHKMQII